MASGRGGTVFARWRRFLFDEAGIMPFVAWFRTPTLGIVHFLEGELLVPRCKSLVDLRNMRE